MLAFTKSCACKALWDSDEGSAVRPLVPRVSLGLEHHLSDLSWLWDGLTES